MSKRQNKKNKPKKSRKNQSVYIDGETWTDTTSNNLPSVTVGYPIDNSLTATTVYLPEFQVINNRKIKREYTANFLAGLINKIPDGMLLKVLTIVFEKLIIKVPPERRKELMSAFAKFIVMLAEGIAEGMGRGISDGIKEKYGSVA